MRQKPVPRPVADLAVIEEYQRAVPLVPGSETDCCTRLCRRTETERRAEARRWLTFLRALGLVRQTDSGFVRTVEEPETDVLARRLRANVFGVEELCTILAETDGPQTTDALFDAFSSQVPNWERNKTEDWREEWRERIAELLEWMTLCNLLSHDDSGYRLGADC